MRLLWRLTARWRCLEWGNDHGRFVFDQCIRWKGHKGLHLSQFGNSFRGDEGWTHPLELAAPQSDYFHIKSRNG